MKLFSQKALHINPSLSDEELLPLLQDPHTNEAAFALLIDRYSRPLYSLVRRIVLNHDDTDDVLQNVFIKIWQGIALFRGDSKLSTWLYSIATNEALSFIRKEKVERKMPLATDEYDLARQLTSDPMFDGEEAEALLLAAIDQLPEKQKITFQLRYYEDLSYQEISEITGTSVGALKANYHHAVAKLQKFLGLDD